MTAPIGPLYSHPSSRQELLSPEPPPGLTAAYRHLQEAWTRLSSIFQGKDGALILRRIRDSSAQEIESNLRACFAETDSAIPLDVLANYLAGAQLALVQWWLETRRPRFRLPTSRTIRFSTIPNSRRPDRFLKPVRSGNTVHGTAGPRNLHPLVPRTRARHAREIRAAPVETIHRFDDSLRGGRCVVWSFRSPNYGLARNNQTTAWLFRFAKRRNNIIVAAAITAALGLPMWIDLIVEYVAGFSFGLFIFQSLFMHDHPDRQQALGLYGALIIDPKTPQNLPVYDLEYTIQLQEWLEREGYTYPAMLMEGALPNFFTINGKAYPSTDTLNMKVGQKIRIRFIGANNNFVHPMHLHGGPFTIIETDGNRVPESARLARLSHQRQRIRKG